MEKLSGQSMDIVADNIAKLKELFPEILTENKIEFNTLKALLGEELEETEERYSFTWHGKVQARRLAQTPSTGTLRPCKEESVDWNATQNLFIEGDNLEVLKLLQKSYHKQVKMIYIDPPYNTGSDFVYPDNFHDNVKNYLELTGQVESGKKIGTNSETSGRYHTDWLNMMYPRLKLSRNLLREDGVILISINDKEQSNLKSICNDVFGEDNFLAQLIWDKNHSAQAGVFKVYHEYVLVYAKNKAFIRPLNPLDNEEFDAGAMKKESARHPMQKFKFPKGTRFDAPDGTEFKGEWGDAEKVILHEGRMLAIDGKLVDDVVIEAAFTQANQMKQFFYGDKDSLLDSRGQKVTEFYFNSTGKLKISKERGVYTPPTIGRWGTQGDVSVNLASLFNMSAPPLETPKSRDMLYEFINWFCNSNDLVLDCFAGSCTTADAVMQANLNDDNLKLKYLMVQFPEPCKVDSEAFKAGYETISDIGKERIRLAAKKLENENPNYQGDLGFKVFKLDSSNLKPWDADFDNLASVLESAADIVKNDRSSEDVLFEILLKYGLDLTLPIETHQLAGKTVYEVGAGALIVCLEDGVTEAVAEAIGKIKETLAPEVMRVVFKDSSFANDAAKVNAVQVLKQYGIEDVKAI